MRLLVIRLSAMGDVALTAPVLKALREQYPDVETVLLTRPAFKPFFDSIEGLQVFPADLQSKYKGITGLLRLFIDIRSQGNFDHVIDLHDVIRTGILSLLFRLNGIRTSVIKKGRNEKRRIIAGGKKIKVKHSVERYRDAFMSAGFHLVLKEGPWIVPSHNAIEKIEPLVTGEQGFLIGVAPYAKHNLKVWPEDNMIILLNMIAEKYNVRFILFGGSDESAKIEALISKIPVFFNSSGTLTLEEELALMSRLDLMIAMDSANMHMAALTGTRVISIWGGTDPIMGFGAWRQPEKHFIRIPVDELTCRPCTVYGTGKCKRGDLACMHWLTPTVVFKKIEELVLSGISK